MTYTDTQLKQALAKMLPRTLTVMCGDLRWQKGAQVILDTELLHLCWLVEKSLTAIEWLKYKKELSHVVWGTPITMECTTRLLWESTWQQRTPALAKVKGIV